MKNDTLFMQEALRQALKGRGKVSPNPLVGAVITRNDKIISKGFHRRAGLAHAEVAAISRVRRSLQGATLYVNLEPCCHWGRTPPCVDIIIASRIKRVVVGCKDPNPEMNGKAIRMLRKRGIQVEVGVEKKESLRINEVFFTNVLKKRAFVALKIAQSLDGKIATKKGESQWITSFKARRYSRGLRDIYDAVLVGVTTIIKDDPFLGGNKKNSYRIVLDPHLRIPHTCQLVNKIPEKLLLFVGQESSEKKRSKSKFLRNAGVKIIEMAVRREGFNLANILSRLLSFGISSLFVEGGSATAAHFFDQKLVDRLYTFIAPKIIGGKDALPSLGGKGWADIARVPRLKETICRPIGSDFLFEGVPHFQDS